MGAAVGAAVGIRSTSLGRVAPACSGLAMGSSPVCARRLVGQDNGGLVGPGTGNGHALLLSAR